LFVTESLVINGWNIFAHSLFLDQLEDRQIEKDTI
jgi:hypothetical protein